MRARLGSDLTVTDMFCGCGGSSIGAEEAGAKLRLGLNHWRRAIETHSTNFPHADHDCTDVSATDPRRYPRTDILLASPECTNHSLAKGAKRKGLSQYDAFIPITQDPAAERSRATMWDVVRFAEYHRYQLVIVENVVDVWHWEPYRAWLQAMDSLGYAFREVYLNSMFAHPTPQSRDRIYIVFWRKGNRAPDLEIRPRAWCTRCECNVESIQSWKRPDRKWGRYRQQYVYRCPACATEVTPYYYAGLNAIDWTIPSERIGDRKRPLRPRTLERIRYGLEKFGRTPLIVTGRYTSGIECRVRDATAEPMPTQPGHISHAVLLPWMLDTAHTSRGEGYARSGDQPLYNQTTAQKQGVVIPPSFLMTYRNYEGTDGYPVDGLDAPLRTAATNNQYRLIINGAALMALRDYDRIQQLVREVTDPLHTQIAKPQLALIQRQPFLISYYGTHNGGPVSEAMGTLSTRDRHALVTPDEEFDVDDCYFRMLKPHEIKAGMAFHPEYVITGNASEQVKQLGNAVTPPAQKILCSRAIESLAA